MTFLEDKRIVLGVTGGIAVYKSPDLVRRLQDAGAEVQVVMTSGAAEFVTPLTFQAVSGRPVRDNAWDRGAEAAMSHIELARWADVVLIAPATADVMARLAGGLADDLLTTVCLATEAPLVLCPAMNRVMWSAAATQANRQTLESRGATVFGPGQGDQACGEVGAGRMLEPVDIAQRLGAFFAERAGNGLLQGVNVMVTAGPTRERIDPVRFISNRSSGRMGYAVAAAAAAEGARVTLVSGPVSLPVPPGVERVAVESAQQMHDAVHQHVDDTDVFIATAAVADYRPARPEDQKIKKTGADSMTLHLDQAPDVLASVSALAKAPFTVGFAAETQRVEEFALAKLEKKSLDMIAANRVCDGRGQGPALGFDSEDNQLMVLWRGGKRELERAPKAALARELVAIVAERYAMARATRARPA